MHASCMQQEDRDTTPTVDADSLHNLPLPEEMSPATLHALLGIPEMDADMLGSLTQLPPVTVPPLFQETPVQTTGFVRRLDAVAGAALADTRTLASSGAANPWLRNMATA